MFLDVHLINFNLNLFSTNLVHPGITDTAHRSESKAAMQLPKFPSQGQGVQDGVSRPLNTLVSGLSCNTRVPHVSLLNIPVKKHGLK